MTHNDLLAHYSLSETDLFALYEHLCDFLERNGIRVSLTSLEPVIETDIYRPGDISIREEEKHHESCISDGLEVFLHEDLEEVGGILSRVYDLLHVGCGHVWQWNSDKTSGLRFFGDNAWDIASVFFLGKPEAEIQLVREYEKEAGILAITRLRSILNGNSFPERFRASCLQLYNDYIQNDLRYIIDYYRSGKVENFFEGWKFGTAELPSIDLSFMIDPRRRRNKCISLISLR